MVVRTANKAPRRIRDDARERLAVMAFSLAASAGVALLLHFLPVVTETVATNVSQTDSTPGSK